MSTFQMGFKNFFVFTALLLAWKVCRVYGQAARVEYINQPYTSSVATSVQTTPQLVVVSPYESYIQESVPTVPCCNGFNGYSNYAPSYPQPMSPIIIEDDDNDNWHNILYFLLFAMRNKRNCGSGNFGGCSGGCNGRYNGGCGCGGNCGGCCCCNCGGCCCCNCGGCCCCNCGGGYDKKDFCGCGNCGGYSNNNLGSGCSCIPYPIPYPMSGPYSYSFPGFGGYPDNSYGYIQETYQTGQGSTDINLIIRTDQSSSG